MKRPNISFNKEAIAAFFLNHVEKIVVALVGCFACSLLWGGIDALRSKSVRREHRPDTLLTRSASTTGHIDRVPRPPDELFARKRNLGAEIEPWLRPDVQAPADIAIFDAPIFQERQKRTKPEVFPIEELQAVAGIAVLAIPPRQAAKQAAGGRDVEPAAPDPAPQPGAAAATVQARITPFVVVTGLVPVARQSAHYQSRYEAASFRDPKRDVPIWSDYVVERCVGPVGGPEQWQPIDLRQSARVFRETWAGPQGESLPPQFLLDAGQVRYSKPGASPDVSKPGAGYCGPLPQLAKGAWGIESLHPRFLRELRKMAAARAPAAPADGDGGAAAPPPPPPPPSIPDHRLLRFVDTNVEPGKTYRYRARLSVWNPNYKLSTQHVADASLAKDPLLDSPMSNTTAPVTVPGSTTVLVRSERRAETKRLKTGLVEVLVLGENPLTGNYSLRSLITEIGGIVNVDKRLNRPAETRTRGEDIVTDRLLIDMRGRQEDREDRPQRSSSKPEPVEMLLRQPDGSFELVTAADSQPIIDRYLGTLPLPDEPKAARGERTAEPAPANADNPFAKPTP